MRRDLVEWANEAVSVVDVLRMDFDTSVPEQGLSYKTWCPFGFEHPDGGEERGFRVYPGTNSAYCFVMHKQLRPVRLIATHNDWSWRRAAEFLLKRAGLFDARPWQERWAEVQAERGVEAPAGSGDPAVLVEALDVHLRAHPAYPPGGVSPALTGALEARLGLLEALTARGAGVDAVRRWYEETKTVLWAVLDEGVMRAAAEGRVG